VNLNAVFSGLRELVRKRMESGGAHGFDHVDRVLKTSSVMAEEEGADSEVVRFAALLHDIDRAREDEGEVKDHAVSSARGARELLQSYGLSEGFILKVVLAIEKHSFKGKKMPSALEEKVLSDADKLDALGAVGIARAYLFGGAYGERVWEKEPKRERFFPGMEASEYSPRTEYELKLSRLEGKMLTRSGKKLARERHRFMQKFFKQLEGEVEGKR